MAIQTTVQSSLKARMKHYELFFSLSLTPPLPKSFGSHLHITVGQ